MKWIIVGLGNVGEKYVNTRHNIGFWVVDRIAKLEAIDWQNKDKFKAKVAKVGETWLIKPNTFMNASGAAVGAMARFYEIEAKQIIVVHDDLDLKWGEIKAGYEKGPKAHNGLISVEQSLGTKEFYRVRVGVDDRSQEERQLLAGEDYVLMVLTKEKLVEFGQMADRAAAEVKKVWF